MTHIDRWTMDNPKPLSRELEISSTARRALIPPPQPNRPIICDCGKRAGWFQPDLYFCPGCRVVIRCWPDVGRVEWTLAQWNDQHPGAIESADYAASAALKPEDPAVF